eukprot:Partr_v1_DN28857_c1_g1_i3_m33976 putative zinc finger CCCH-type containing 14
MAVIFGNNMKSAADIKSKLTSLQLFDHDLSVEFIQMLIKNKRTKEWITRELRDEVALNDGQVKEVDLLVDWLLTDASTDENDDKSGNETTANAESEPSSASFIVDAAPRPTAQIQPLKLQSPPPRQPTLCAYFPNCTKGANCSFYHPPACKFGIRCMNANCQYLHPQASGPAIKQSAGRIIRTSAQIPAVPVALVDCHFGIKCTNARCPYKHPVGIASPIPCKFQGACKNKACPFQHTVVPTKVMDRKFAVTDEPTISIGDLVDKGADGLL